MNSQISASLPLKFASWPFLGVLIDMASPGPGWKRSHFWPTYYSRHTERSLFHPTQRKVNSWMTIGRIDHHHDIPSLGLYITRYHILLHAGSRICMRHYVCTCAGTVVRQRTNVMSLILNHVRPFVRGLSSNSDFFCISIPKLYLQVVIFERKICVGSLVCLPSRWLFSNNC